jgi:MFS family permease
VTTEPKRYQNYLLVTFSITLTAATVSCHQFKVPTIMGELAKSLNMAASASWLMSIFTFVGILLALPAGSMAQKFGPKAMIVGAELLAAAGSLIGSVATSGGLMIFSRGIEGIGFILATVCGPLAIGRFVEPAQMGSAMGIWAICVPVGEILAFTITPVMYGAMGWQAIWLVFAVASMIMAAATQFFVNNKMGNVPTGETASGPAVKFTAVFSQKNLWLLCLAFGLFNLVFLATLSFVPDFLETSGLLGKSAAAFVATLPMLICLISLPVFGKVSDMIQSRKKPLMLALAVLGPAAALMYSTNIALVYLGAVLLGAIGMGVPAIILNSVGQVVASPELVGPGMGLMMIFQNVGMFLGTLIFMPLVGMAGGSFPTAGLVLIPIAVVALIFVLMAKLK